MISDDKESWEILEKIKVPYIPNKKKILREDDEEIVYEGGEVYHKSNRLNNLSNKEWLKFQKS